MHWKLENLKMPCHQDFNNEKWLCWDRYKGWQMIWVEDRCICITAIHLNELSCWMYSCSPIYLICCLCFCTLTCPRLTLSLQEGEWLSVIMKPTVWSVCLCWGCYFITPSITYRQCDCCLFCKLRSESSRRDTDYINGEADCLTWYLVPASNAVSCWVYSLIPTHTLFFWDQFLE